ncbi:MAG: FixH family protein [Chromatiales bacterium]
MTHLLLSLGLGLAAILLVFFGIYRFTRLGGKEVALLVGLAALGVYVPFGILFWPGADVFALHVAFFVVTPYGLGIISSRWEASSDAERQAGWFHWAPAGIVVFFIGIAVVDAVIISLAGRGLTGDWAAALLPEPRSGGEVRSVFPGTVYHDFHEKEALYNAYLEQQRRQQARGWQVRQGWLDVPVSGEERVFQVEVRDPAGEPIEAATVTVDFLRPSDHRQDRSLQLEEVGPGRYQAILSLSEPGTWDVVIQIRRDEDLHQLQGTTSVRATAAS